MIVNKVRLLALVLFVSVIYCAKWVPTPHGLQWDECIVKVASGSEIIDIHGEETIVKSPNGEITKYGSCERPNFADRKIQGEKSIKSSEKLKSSQSTEQPKLEIIEGWQVWASYNTPNNDTFTEFLGNFTTPGAPPQWPQLDDAILYLFTGLQSDNWVPDYQPVPPSPPSGFDIIQPVIQYGGGSENGGGKYWGVASWYVTVDFTRSFWSDLITLNPGDEVFGNMTQTGPTTWYIGAVVPSGQNTSLTITKSRLENQPWAYVTLEVYDIQNCDWFPVNSYDNTVKFTNLILTTASGVITPVWDTFASKNLCNTSIQVVSPSDINIVW